MILEMTHLIKICKSILYDLIITICQSTKIALKKLIYFIYLKSFLKSFMVI